MAKFIYIDEAGTHAGSPVTVVAGIVVDPDAQWSAALQRLEEIREMVPIEVPHDFVFHATEIYSGGRTLARTKYGKETRFPLLEKLLQTPRELRLPVFFAWQKKDSQFPDWDPRHEMFFRHANTFLHAIKMANLGLRRFCPGERAAIVAEDVPSMRRWLMQLPGMLREPAAPAFFVGPEVFDSIVDVPNFAKKADAPLLQLADALAFALRHYLSEHKDGNWALDHVFGAGRVDGIMSTASEHDFGGQWCTWP